MSHDDPDPDDHKAGWPLPSEGDLILMLVIAGLFALWIEVWTR